MSGWRILLAEARRVDCRRPIVFGEPVAYRLGSPGRHIVLNSLAVLAAVAGARRPISRWRRWRSATSRRRPGAARSQVLKAPAAGSR
jgi:hypothetical protein